eukprot:scaffold37347_cov72-Phaeocystis_antarctica.AAC.1
MFIYIYARTMPWTMRNALLLIHTMFMACCARPWAVRQPWPQPRTAPPVLYRGTAGPRALAASGCREAAAGARRTLAAPARRCRPRSRAARAAPTRR